MWWTDCLTVCYGVFTNRESGMIRKFEELEIWQDGRMLTQRIYQISKHGEFAKDYGLRDQIRKAAISITSNIAEGFDRNSNKQFIHFLSIAKGSVSEVRSQLYVALDERYINQSVFDELYQLAHQTLNKLGGLMHYLENSPRDLRTR